MKKTLCGLNCEECAFFGKCRGCAETCGSPFGGTCIAAEYIKAGDREGYEAFKAQLIREFNELCIPGMPEVKDLNLLCGSYVNLAYPLANGVPVQFLKNEDIYLGNQLCPVFSDGGEEERCFGIIGGLSFLMVVEYGAMGAEPELLLYKKR